MRSVALTPVRGFLKSAIRTCSELRDEALRELQRKNGVSVAADDGDFNSPFDLTRAKEMPRSPLLSGRMADVLF